MIDNIKQTGLLKRQSPPTSRPPVVQTGPEDTFQRAQVSEDRGVNWKQLAAGAGLLAATALGSQAAHAQEAVVEADLSQSQVVDLSYSKQGDTTMKRTSSARERREERRNRSSISHRSDGTVEHRHGNISHRSDGTVVHHHGNVGHRSDGVVETRHGSFVHGSDGSVTWSPE